MPIPRILTDPLPAYRFRIALIDSSSTLGALAGLVNLATGGFSECSGLDAVLQIEDYIEGGENTYVHKFPTRVTWSNITLKRGVGISDSLWQWHEEFVLGKGKRRDGLIVMQNDLGAPIKAWVFKRGLPVKWTGPTFNASQNAIAIESIEIAHAGLELAGLGKGASEAGAEIAGKVKNVAARVFG